MNITFKKLGFASLVVMAGAALFGINDTHAGIKGSKHDLGTGGASQYLATGGTGEICVFCHTPHGADTAGGAPLWNKSLPAAGSYTRYSSLNMSTIEGTETTVGSVSLACLSCHDGSQAMDVMINAPGTDGYDADGASFNSLAVMAAGIANLGVDISNDHPISIQYAGGGLDSTDADGLYNNTNFGDADFQSVYKKTINGTPTWWVEGSGGGTTRQKTEMLLYTRTYSTVVQPFVECASCHDPHNSTTNTFLRVSNDASAVCLACHVK